MLWGKKKKKKLESNRPGTPAQRQLNTKKSKSDLAKQGKGTQLTAEWINTTGETELNQKRYSKIA